MGQIERFHVSNQTISRSIRCQWRKCLIQQSQNVQIDRVFFERKNVHIKQNRVQFDDIECSKMTNVAFKLNIFRVQFDH